MCDGKITAVFATRSKVYVFGAGWHVIFVRTLDARWRHLYSDEPALD